MFPRVTEGRLNAPDTTKNELALRPVTETSTALHDCVDHILLPFNLRIFVVADTHNCLTEDEIRGKDADVCLLLGDLTARDIQILKRSISPMPICGVLGNHDDWRLYEDNGIENIHGRVVSVNGVRIAGLQGSIRHKDSDYPLYTDEESSALAQNMGSADILISHDCPKHLHDDLHGADDFAHSGLQGVTDYCVNYNVPLNLHGHHHVNSHKMLDSGTVSICCHKVVLINISEPDAAST